MLDLCFPCFSKVGGKFGLVKFRPVFAGQQYGSYRDEQRDEAQCVCKARRVHD